MGLLSSFRRHEDSAAAAAGPEDATAIRQRARRRLIGASVLLAIGVIGFPLVFETQPRPIPVDIPIEIPRKEGAPPLLLPNKRPVPAAVALPPEPTASAVATTSIAPRGVAAEPRPAPAAASGAVAAGKSASAPTRSAAAAPPPGDEGRRAQALLEGKDVPNVVKASEPGAVRVVVQVGAYAEADKLRAARQKVEQLGLKTYTQVVEADGTSKTRVRVGPFATRQEAEQAAARIKAAGLPAAILVL